MHVVNTIQSFYAWKVKIPIVFLTQKATFSQSSGLHFLLWKVWPKKCPLMARGGMPHGRYIRILESWYLGLSQESVALQRLRSTTQKEINSDFSLWRDVLQNPEDGVRSENIFLWNQQFCTMTQCKKVTPVQGHCSSFVQQSPETHIILLLFIHTNQDLPRLLEGGDWEWVGEEVKILSYLIWECPCLGI